MNQIKYRSDFKAIFKSPMEIYDLNKANFVASEYGFHVKLTNAYLIVAEADKDEEVEDFVQFLITILKEDVKEIGEIQVTRTYDLLGVFNE